MIRSEMFFAALGQLCVLIPAGISCDLTTIRHLRWSFRKTTVVSVAAYTAFAFAGAFFHADLGVPMWFLGICACAALLLVFRTTCNIGWARFLAVYTGILAIETFPMHFAFAVDAFHHPEGGAACMSAQGAFFQLLFSAILLAAFAYPASHQFAALVDDLDMPHFWTVTIAASAIFLAANLTMVPFSYSTLRVGRIEFIYPAFEAAILVILIAVYLLFYRGARLILEKSRAEERSAILELEARHYRALRSYIDETRRLRHDFRHSVHLLSTLAKEGDLEAVRDYLHSFETSEVSEIPFSFCRNAALNALFAYYHQQAAAAGIRTHWELNLPDPLPFSEVDMASLFGNLMENAIEGCATAPCTERSFRLSTAMQADGLYIVATNSFASSLRRGSKGYLSTKSSGSGTGLRSIAAIAHKYHGQAAFSDKKHEFWVDVFLSTGPDSGHGTGS